MVHSSLNTTFRQLAVHWAWAWAQSCSFLLHATSEGKGFCAAVLCLRHASLKPLPNQFATHIQNKGVSYWARCHEPGYSGRNNDGSTFLIGGFPSQTLSDASDAPFISKSVDLIDGSPRCAKCSCDLIMRCATHWHFYDTLPYPLIPPRRHCNHL